MSTINLADNTAQTAAIQKFNFNGNKFGIMFTVAALTAIKGSAFANADVVQLFNAKAGDFVKNVKLFVKTAMSTGTPADVLFNIGVTGDDTDGFVAAGATHIEAYTAGQQVGAQGSYYIAQDGTAPYAVTLAEGKYFEAADTVDLLAAASTMGTNGTFLVTWEQESFGALL